MAKKTERRGNWWSMKNDRELIALSKTKKLDAIAKHFERPPGTILNAAKRLGVKTKKRSA
jgi:hypothetical protein